MDKPKLSNPHLIKALNYDITQKDLNLLANKAVAFCRKAYSFWGSLTKDDLYSEAWLGLISCINKPKFETCEDKPSRLAYLFTFARGYCTHALHRQSRMIRVPGKHLKDSQPHLSLDAGNLPTPTVEPPELTPFCLLAAIDKISSRDQSRILNKNPRLSKKTIHIIDKIKCSNFAL